MADLALLLLTLFWGTTFLIVKRTLEGTSPGAFLLLRFGVATLALAAVWLFRRDRPTPGVWRDGFLLGVSMWAGFTLQTLGLRHTTPSRSGFLTGLAVLIVPFLARFFLRRKVHAASWAGVALAVIGLALLTRPFAVGVSAEVRFGDALTVGCAVAFAVQIVLTGEWSARHPLAVLTFVQIAVAFAGATLLASAEPTRLGPGPSLLGAVLFTGVAMTAAAFFVQNWGQRHTTAVRAALIFSLEPVAAALFSHFCGGEPLSGLDWVGGGLIVLGVAVGEVAAALRALRDLPKARGDV